MVQLAQQFLVTDVEKRPSLNEIIMPDFVNAKQLMFKADAAKYVYKG